MVWLPPGEIRPVKPISVATCVPNGTKKSATLVAWPAGVAMAICPEVAVVGTVALTCVLVALVTAPREPLNDTLSFATISKFVPVSATEVPGAPIVGVNPVIVGAPELAATVKTPLLVTEPEGVVTVIGPVVAVAGTAATI